MQIELDQACGLRDEEAPLWVRFAAPPAGAPAALRAVQEAVAADLRERLSAAVDWMEHLDGHTDGLPDLEFAPGAGALLAGDSLTVLVSALSRAPRRRLVLPLDDTHLAGNPGWPWSAGTCFAAGSAADLIALSLHPDAGPRTREALGALSVDNHVMRSTLALFTDRDAEVTLFGPVQTHTWRYLENQVACRVRLFADGDAAHAGLAAELYRGATADEFLDWLAQVGNAAFLDSRQFLAGAERPGDLDFFYSDLGRPELVEGPALRALTLMALGARFPLVLGGASVVNGVLYTLVEAAWAQHADVDRGYQISW